MTTTLLQLTNVAAVYDRASLALQDISLTVTAGSIVALLGANGAGKTTTLKAISNLLRAERGAVTHGTIHYRGRDITHADPADLVAAGLVQVLEGRHCFAHLTVEENLRMGAVHRRLSARELRAQLDPIYQLFPRLRERRRSQAGYTSGGEQQMIAIGRALMAAPSLVLLDEPSMGLAPQIVEEIFEIVSELNRTRSVSFLVAEQNAAIALRYADHAYIVESGHVLRDGPAAELLDRDRVRELYLGRDHAAESVAASRTRPRRPEFALPDLTS
jgi:branched-chain amino acid transport system ATP-binding protein